MEGKCDDVLVERLDIDEYRLVGLIQKTFVQGTMDKFQKSLIWKLLSGAVGSGQALHACVWSQSGMSETYVER